MTAYNKNSIQNTKNQAAFREKQVKGSYNTDPQTDISKAPECFLSFGSDTKKENW